MLEKLGGSVLPYLCILVCYNLKTSAMLTSVKPSAVCLQTCDLWFSFCLKRSMQLLSENFDKLKLFIVTEGDFSRIPAA